MVPPRILLIAVASILLCPPAAPAADPVPTFDLVTDGQGNLTRNALNLGDPNGKLTGTLATSHLALGVGLNLDTTANWSTNTGGYISTLPGGGHILTGHNGGYISTGFNGGFIDTSAAGGFIDTAGGATLPGGSINTSNGGGLIQTNGSGSPNGVVTAPVGSLYTDQAGASGQVLYVKESGSGNTGWVAKGSASAPAVLTTGLVAEYRFDEGTGRVANNHAKSSALPANLFASPEVFGNYFWNAGPTTDNYALAPFGGGMAARFNGSFNSINQNVTIPAAGTYTLSVYVQSNTGVSQTMRVQLNGNYSSDITIPATGWLRVTQPVTYTGATTDTVSPVVTNTAGGPLDVLFCYPQFELGSTASTYHSAAGDAAFLGAPVWNANGVDFTAANSQAAGAITGQYFAGLSAYVVFQWPTANTPADPTSVALLTDGIYGGGSKFYVTLANGYQTYLGSQISTLQALGKLAASVHDSAFHLLTTVYDGTQIRLRIDGREVAQGAGTTAPFILNLIDFANLGRYFAFPGVYAYASVYNIGHSSAQIIANEAAIRAQLLANKGVAVANASYLAFEGDSITADWNGSPNTVPFLVTIPAGVQAHDWAVPGNQIADLTARAPLVDASVLTGQKNVLYIGPLHNDMDAGGASAATFVASLKTYCLARRAAGWNKIIVSTTLPSTATGFNAKRDAANTAIRADTSFYDYLVDYDTQATMGNDATPSNTTYYADGTHPTQAGENLLSPIAQPQITAALP